MLKPTTIEKISLNETENVTLVSKSITGQISSLFWQKVCILHTFFIDLSLFCNLHLLTYKTYRVSPQAFDQNWRSIFTQIRWLFHFSKPKCMQIFTKFLQKMEICPSPCTSLTPNILKHPVHQIFSSQFQLNCCDFVLALNSLGSGILGGVGRLGPAVTPGPVFKRARAPAAETAPTALRRQVTCWDPLSPLDHLSRGRRDKRT